MVVLEFITIDVSKSCIYVFIPFERKKSLLCRVHFPGKISVISNFDQFPDNLDSTLCIDHYVIYTSYYNLRQQMEKYRIYEKELFLVLKAREEVDPTDDS